MHSGGAWLAVRKGSWVLVPARAEAKTGGLGRPQLFDLSADLGQERNLAVMYPSKVKELAELLESAKKTQGTRRR